MKYAVLGVLLFFFNKSSAQCVDLKLDTISIYKVKRINLINRDLIEFQFFKVGDTFYDATNFPFFALKCWETNSSNLFLENYDPIINHEKVNNLLKKLSKSTYIDIDNFKDHSLEIFGDCLKNSKENKFTISKQEFVATFFLISCNVKKGIGEGFFCKELINQENIPIIIDVKHIR